MIPRRLPCSATLFAPSLGLGWPVTVREVECARASVCVWGGRGRPQGEPAVPRPPRQVTPSPVGGDSKASSHQLVGNGARGARDLHSPSTSSRRPRENGTPMHVAPYSSPRYPQSPALTSRPGLRCSSHPRGAAQAGDHAPGVGGKSFFSRSLAAHPGRLLLSSLSWARCASALPPPLAGGGGRGCL